MIFIQTYRKARLSENNAYTLVNFKILVWSFVIFFILKQKENQKNYF